MRKVLSATRLIAGALVLVLAGSAAAQKVYRITGPDGKVTFSDQPPSQGDATLLRGGPRAPAAAASAAGAETPGAPAGDAHGAKRATRVREGAAGATPAAADRALQNSVVELLSNEQIVARFERLCTGTVPGSRVKFSGAADRWRQRHASLNARRDAVMGEMLDAAHRNSLIESARMAVEATFAPVEQMDTRNRAQWCDRNTEQLNAGRLDRHQDASITAPLLAFRGRP